MTLSQPSSTWTGPAGRLVLQSSSCHGSTVCTIPQGPQGTCHKQGLPAAEPAQPPTGPSGVMDPVSSCSGLEGLCGQKPTCTGLSAEGRGALVGSSVSESCPKAGVVGASPARPQCGRRRYPVSLVKTPPPPSLLHLPSCKLRKPGPRRGPLSSPQGTHPSITRPRVSHRLPTLPHSTSTSRDLDDPALAQLRADQPFPFSFSLCSRLFRLF